MKKWLCLLALLTAASLTLLVAAHISLYRQRDRVVIYQTTLAGDPASAEGLTVTFHDQQRGQLFWDSAIPLGTAEPQAETEFRFYSRSPIRERFFFREELEIRFWGDTDGLGVTNSTGYERFDALWERMLQALPKEAPLGEERTATLAVRDFCDYLPLYIRELDLASYGLYAEDTEGGLLSAAEELARYLNVVPPEDWTLEVTYTDCGESQTASAAYAVEPPQVLAQATEGGLYLCLKTDRPEMIQCRDGAGLWYVPFQDTGRTAKAYYGTGSQPETLPVVTLDVSGAQVVLPFDPCEAVPLALEPSESGEDLLLYLREGEDLVLHVVDAASGRTRQELTLAEGVGEGLELSFVPAEPSGRLAVLSDGTFALAAEEAGRYVLTCAGVLEAPAGLETDEAHFLRAMTAEENEPAALWDGERLAWASTAYKRYNIHMGFYAAVFDRAGEMTYLGRYQTTRGRGGDGSLSGSYLFDDTLILELSAG